MKQTTQRANDSRFSPQLYIAMELSKKQWRLAFSDGTRSVRQVVIPAGALEVFQEEIKRAQKKYGLGEDCEIASCYEAGREAFWLHRCLTDMGIHNLIVDSSSIEVSRRKRRAKTDRLDAQSLVFLLRRHFWGENVWSVVHVPSEIDEDDRRLHRELARLTKERTGHTNRIKALLFTQGIELPINKRFEAGLDTAKLWNGSSLPENLKGELKREYKRLHMLEEQKKELEKERRRRIREEESEKMEKVRLLQSLRGIGDTTSWVLTMEFFGWREFKNGKQVGALAGLTPTPYDSGESQREQGISKAGLPSIRSLMVEIGWFWLRYQPNSRISQWYEERFSVGRRARRVGIVGVARRLQVALWQFTEHGVIPEGAEFKKA